MAANLPADNTAAGIRPQKAEIRAFGAAVEKALIEAARPEPRAEARTFAAVCGIDGLEGIVSKDRGRAYCVGKCRHRIKVKSRAQPAYCRVQDLQMTTWRLILLVWAHYPCRPPRPTATIGRCTNPHRPSCFAATLFRAAKSNPAKSASPGERTFGAKVERDLVTAK
jgi:hypothetical protein